jgi:carbon storage regulator
MLVLSRKPGQLIRIGSDVEVMVLSIRGERVRVGLTAPADVRIHREEVFERIARSHRAGDVPIQPLTATPRRRRPACHVPDR